ncbi:hypothetical protein FRC14_003795 [Serendipita sp. 396]|nr:hypothetical protein FRC14_003795 [Serendipita sp. 396]KAG8782832.1 hypothetical protein FRC15_006218 [Serendipita sp. 397]KAG8808645.1 hypothetical protein FRC18_004917 [Serendipita sp. 400]KAG8867179.1 hypothetical protein FRC20_006529 [Serendipita sp. 405]
MHFAKALILPIVLALTVLAAPVPAPEGNLVTLNARCHPDPNHPCHKHHKHHSHPANGPVDSQSPPQSSGGGGVDQNAADTQNVGTGQGPIPGTG